MIFQPKKILKIEQVQNISIFITFPNLFQEVVFEGLKNNCNPRPPLPLHIPSQFLGNWCKFVFSKDLCIYFDTA